MTPVVCLALLSLLLCLLYIALGLRATDGRPVAALDDAYIHFQYARQLAHGHPWQYNDGDPLSTGATSLLYPILLAAAFLAGFQGEAIVWPALLIGAAALVVSCLLVYQITLQLLDWKEVLPLARPIAVGTATAFLLTGAIPWSYLNGMETGLFTMLVLAALHSFIVGRMGQMCAFLVASSLVRPEGLFLAAAAWAVVLARTLADREQDKRPLILVTIAVALSTMPYLVNMVLTGTPVASGAQAKSWLGNIPFIPGELAYNSARMAVLILERMTLGFLASRTWPVAPGILIVALLGAAGVWRRGDRWTVLLAALWFAVGVLTTSTLITAIWHVGRYQVPSLALTIPFAGAGAGSALAYMHGRWRSAVAGGIAAWLVLAGLSSAQAAVAFYDAVASTRGQQLALAGWLAEHLPQDALVAVHDAGALRYVGERRTYDMIGLTTQGAAEAWRHGSGAIFESMDRASPRPDYFATYPDVATLPYFAETDLFARELFVSEPYGRRTASTAGPVQAVYEADWRTAAGADRLRQEDLQNMTGGLEPLTSIDLADLVDEAQHGLTWTTGRTQPGFPTEARQFRYRADPTLELLDGGRLVSGALRFPLRAELGRPLTIAARLHAPEAGAVEVTVNGRDAGLWRYPAVPGAWLESAFVVPADLVDAAELAIELRLVDPQGTAQPFQIYQLWAFQGEPAVRSLSPEEALDVRFGEGIALEGLDIAGRTAARGKELPLTLYWRAGQAQDLDAKVFVHLYDNAGQLVAQVDQRPYHDTRPPYTWRPGEQIRDPLLLPIPVDLQPGVYQLALGLYNAQSGERLPVVTAAGVHPPDGRLALGEITVTDQPDEGEPP